MGTYIQRRGAEADTLNAVIEAYNATNSPRALIDTLIETLGEADTVKAVATLVNAVSLHDGRISDFNRSWAQGVEGAPSNEHLHGIGIYGVDSWIHSAHVDNVAQAMRAYLRENEIKEAEEKRLSEKIKTDTENRRHCESIRADLNDIVSEVLCKCSECGATFNVEEAEETEEGYICPYCSELVRFDDLEPVAMWDYFADALDIAYTIGSDGSYRGVRIMVAWGGPNIYVDTVRGSVDLYWWGDEAHVSLFSETIEAIDQAFEELYLCTR